ncbi:MAG: hypothetical protein J3K34DRAFT_462600 [Monoraphidium minutum]|nr:MAG: hypothetical protein J3K34DRAFT_462600 [Monoraphidium minutum]
MPCKEEEAPAAPPVGGAGASARAGAGGLGPLRLDGSRARTRPAGRCGLERRGMDGRGGRGRRATGLFPGGAARPRGGMGLGRLAARAQDHPAVGDGGGGGRAGGGACVRGEGEGAGPWHGVRAPGDGVRARGRLRSASRSISAAKATGGGAAGSAAAGGSRGAGPGAGSYACAALRRQSAAGCWFLDKTGLDRTERRLHDLTRLDIRTVFNGVNCVFNKERAALRSAGAVADTKLARQIRIWVSRSK